MRKSIVFASILSACLCARADWLLWTVTTDDASAFSDAASAQIGYVQTGVSAESGGQIFTGNWALDQSVDYGNPVGLSASEKQASMVDLTEIGSGSIADYSFYVELLNNSGEVIGRTSAGENNTYMTYQELKGYVASASIGSVPQAAVWHGGSFSAVPEPSSFALLALGAGLVGLRRRLRKGKKGKRA